MVLAANILVANTPQKCENRGVVRCRPDQTTSMGKIISFMGDCVHSYEQFFYSIDLSEGIGFLYKVWGDAIGHKFLRELLWNYILAEYKLKYTLPAGIMEMHVIISWWCGWRDPV